MNCRFLFSCLLLLSGGLAAAGFVPAKVEVKQVPVYQPERFSLRQGAILYNQMARYSLTLTQSKTDGGKPPRLGFTLSSGSFGFSPLVQFFKVKVNGIEQHQLIAEAEDLRACSDQDRAGCELKLNFDGVRLILQFYLRPDSPVLWGSLRMAPDTLEPMQNGTVEICLIPSMLAKENQKPVWSGGYARMAVTPVRTIEQNPKIVTLTPEDEYLIVQDRIYDGSGPDKGQGPCMILLDWQDIDKAALRVNDDWTTAVVLNLKPGFREFRFGLWQQEPRISNLDFLRKLQQEQEAFRR